MAKKKQAPAPNITGLKDSPVKTVRQRVQALDPEAPVVPYPSSPARGEEAGLIKAEATRDATKTSEVGATRANPVGSNPFRDPVTGATQPVAPPSTGSWGLPRDPAKFARLTRTPSTRGHRSVAEHVRQLESTASSLGLSTNVNPRGEIRGLSSESPVVPPGPIRFKDPDTKQVKRGVGYTHRADKSAPKYTGGQVNSDDMKRWGTQGRPDLLDAVAQHSQISTPGGLRGDRSPGARGVFSGMNPEELQTAVKAEVLPDRIARGVSDLMRPGNVHRARQVPKPYGLAGGGMTPAQKEMTDTVTVQKGGRTRAMTTEQHSQRAERQIAKRKKSEMTEGES